MTAKNNNSAIVTIALILIPLLSLSACEGESAVLPGPGIYVTSGDEYLALRELEEYGSGLAVEAEGFPGTTDPSPAIVISDDAVDTNYLVIRSILDGASVKYSLSIENEIATIQIEDPLADGIYCLVVEDPFSDTYPAWCFLSGSSATGESPDNSSVQALTEPPSQPNGSSPTSTQELIDPTITVTPELPTSTPRPDYSFDLAFASDATGRFRVYTFNTETGESELLKIPEGSKAAYWSTFCGDKIAAEVELNGNDGQAIAFLDPVKANTFYFDVPLAVRQSGVPRCNPEGNLLAYSAQEGNRWALYVQDINTMEVDRFYAPSNVASGYASWVLARNDLVFNVVDTSNANLIYILEDALSDPNYVKFGSGGNPAISPDGSQLVYSCKAPNVNERVLCIDSLFGSGEREELVIVYRRPAEGLETNQIQPASMWSADGEWIYYSSAEDGDWDVYRIHPDGSGRENLTDDWGGGSSNEIYPAVRW